MPKPIKKVRTTSLTVRIRPDASKPSRLTYSWPSGNSVIDECAQGKASVVLPIPAWPVITVIAGPVRGAGRESRSSSASRPASRPIGGGSWRGTVTVCPPASRSGSVVITP